MFPMLIHDWIAHLELIGYRPIYGENAFKEPTVFFAYAYPGDIVDTLRLTQKLFDRGERIQTPEISRSVLTDIGVVYVDYRRGTDNEWGTRITVPTGLPEVVKESNLERYKALVENHGE